MSEWREYKLSEIINIIGGGTPSRSNPEFWGGTIPWLSVKDFNAGRRYVENTEEHITPLGLNKSSTKILTNGQVIISARGTVGELAQIVGEMAFNQSCYGLDAKSEYLTNDYLYYLIKYTVSNLKKLTHGAVFDTITKNTFDYANVKIPESKQQTEIVKILGSLDDKIELNRKMNETLEEMGKAIFKSWFVDFDPVHAKARGEKPAGMPDEIADLFPSEFVHSDQLNKPIPKGWEVKPLKELIDFNPTRKLQKGSVVPYVEMSSLPEQGMSIKSFYEREFKSGSKFVNGDTLFARITPCLENGKTAFVDCLNDSEVGWGSTEFIVMRSKAGIPDFFSYLVARSEWFRTVAIGSMTGSSGRQRASKEALEELLVAIPCEAVFKAFNDLIGTTPEKIKSSHMQSQTLAELRDSLLPKLISGEIEV